jgi:4-amino-4-deoxy-L-arabinose transferase-like glycosyltransferase
MSTHRAPGSAYRFSERSQSVLLRWGAGAVIALSTVLFVLAGCAGLSDPGLEYDELLFVNGALGDPYRYHDFIYQEVFGIPTMLMPYIGALKAWLYEPIFSVFGVSVDSVRIPAVLLAALILLLAARLAYRLLGLWPAALLMVLMASDPAYGAMARTDWGPILLSALFRVLALLCYFAFLRSRSTRYLWLGVAALLLGLFNKLDFSWFIAALGVAAVTVHGRELIDVARRRPLAVLAPIGVLLVVSVAAIFALILPADQLPTTAPQLSLGARISEVIRLFRDTFDGAGVYENMTASHLSHSTLIGILVQWILLGSIAVAVWNLVWGRRLGRNHDLRRTATTITFFLVLFCALAGAITVTRQATGPWHVMLLWPLPAVLWVGLFVFATQVRVRKLKWLGVGVVGVALCALLASQVRTSAIYVDAYRSDRRWSSPWSTEIYAATRSISQAAPGVESIVGADWGLGTEIFALGSTSVRERFTDAWSSFTSPTASPTSLENEWFQDRRVIVVYHSRAAEMMPLTTQHVEAIIKTFGSHTRPIFVGRQIEAVEVIH